jgi:hypothetical protein
VVQCPLGVHCIFVMDPLFLEIKKECRLAGCVPGISLRYGSKLLLIKVRLLYLSINASGYSDHGHAHRVQTEDYIPSVALHGSSVSLIVSFLCVFPVLID